MGYGSVITSAKPGSARDPAPLRTRLKLRHARLLVALDAHRKLSQAAVELNLSQPAASKMLGEIEALVGMPLFERLARGVEPTSYGEVMIRRSRSMLTELDLADAEIGALKAGDGGKVAIGTVTAAPAVGLVADALEDLRSKAGRVQVSIDVDASPVLLQELEAGALDFVLARMPVGGAAEPFEGIEIGPEPCDLLVRAGHPLAARTAVAPADLADQTWVLQPQGSLLRREVERMFRRHNIAGPARVIATPSIFMSLALAARSDAVTALGAGVAELFGNPTRFAVLALSEPLVVESYSLIRHANRDLSPAARLCFDAIRSRIPPRR